MDIIRVPYHFFTSNVGFRQGEATSPILFNLHVYSKATDAPLLDTCLVTV